MFDRLAGPPSRAFSTTAASASVTTPPNAPCAALPWDAKSGCSPLRPRWRTGGRHEHPIATGKLNDINPHASLADVLARIADHPALRLNELLPWHWKATRPQAAAA